MEQGRPWLYTYAHRRSAQRALERHLKRAESFRCGLCGESLANIEFDHMFRQQCPIDSDNCKQRQCWPEDTGEQFIKLGTMVMIFGRPREFIIPTNGSEMEIVPQAVRPIRLALKEAVACGRAKEALQVKGALA